VGHKDMEWIQLFKLVAFRRILTNIESGKMNESVVILSSGIQLEELNGLRKILYG
jgi:hypothetical protein